MTVDKDFMEMMLECIPGLLCIDNDGKITYVNEKMLKYKNCTSEQMIGKHIKKFFPYTHMIENMENERDTSRSIREMSPLRMMWRRACIMFFVKMENGSD